jgi:hypothetical protein
MRQLTACDAQFIAGEDGRARGHYVGVGLYGPSTAPAAVVEETLARPLDRSRPLWELILVRGLERPGSG